MPPRCLLRPGFLGTMYRLFVVVLCSACGVAIAHSAALALDQLPPGAIVLVRHALAPGVGDPPGFTLNDCASQRNLDTRGREQAVALGQAFRQAAVPVQRVETSQWCRARDTATLAFPGLVHDNPDFNSFFAGRGSEPHSTQRARDRLLAWRGPGVLVVITHQVNITALTTIFPASGEAIVVLPDQGRLAVLGRLDLPEP